MKYVFAEPFGPFLSSMDNLRYDILWYENRNVDKAGHESVVIAYLQAIPDIFENNVKEIRYSYKTERSFLSLRRKNTYSTFNHESFLGDKIKMFIISSGQ